MIKWFTIGWAIWFGGFILKDLINNKLLLGLSIFTDIKALIVCEITLYIGTLSGLISSVIYNRD